MRMFVCVCGSGRTKSAEMSHELPDEVFCYAFLLAIFVRPRCNASLLLARRRRHNCFSLKYYCTTPNHLFFVSLAKSFLVCRGHHTAYQSAKVSPPPPPTCRRHPTVTHTVNALYCPAHACLRRVRVVWASLSREVHSTIRPPHFGSTKLYRALPYNIKPPCI